MEARHWLLTLLMALPLAAQGPYGTPPKPKVTDYPVHGQAGAVSMGAEYLVRSVPVGDQTLIVPDYLVVEVALYPPAGRPLAVSSGQFTLRLNGKKQVLHAQAPGFVAASLKYPDWEQRPTVVVHGGIGNAGVILGRPEQVERFPGDRRPTETRLPRPPTAPVPEDPSGLPRPEALPPEDAVNQTALPSGDFRAPVSGYLYFAYKGKPKSVKTLDLIYAGPAGGAVLRLAP